MFPFSQCKFDALSIASTLFGIVLLCCFVNNSLDATSRIFPFVHLISFYIFVKILIIGSFQNQASLSLFVMFISYIIFVNFIIRNIFSLSQKYFSNIYFSFYFKTQYFIKIECTKTMHRKFYIIYRNSFLNKHKTKCYS